MLMGSMIFFSILNAENIPNNTSSPIQNTSSQEETKEVIKLSDDSVVVKTVESAEEKKIDQSFEEKKYEEIYTEQHKRLIGVYNAPYRIKIKNDWNFFKQASYLYWQALINNSFFGTWNNSQTANPLYIDPAQDPHRQLVNYGDDFHSGFKIGAGYKTPLDNWTVFLQYTWFSPHSHHHVTNYPITNVLLFPQDPEFPLSSAILLKGNWKTNLNIFDFEIARAFYIAQFLSLNFHIGPKGYTNFSKEAVHYRIYQNLSNDIFDESPEYRYYNKSKTWGIGGRIGCQVDWLFTHMRLFTHGSYSLAYQNSSLHYYSKFPENTIYEDQNRANYHDDQSSVANILEATFGFAYQTLIGEEKYFIDLSLAYEFQYWTSQSMHAEYRDIQTNYIPSHEAYTTLGTPFHPGPLFLHGLTATIRLDF
jgi:hypothetical protein